MKVIGKFVMWDKLLKHFMLEELTNVSHVLKDNGAFWDRIGLLSHLDVVPNIMKMGIQGVKSIAILSILVVVFTHARWTQKIVQNVQRGCISATQLLKAFPSMTMTPFVHQLEGLIQVDIISMIVSHVIRLVVPRLLIVIVDNQHHVN